MLTMVIDMSIKIRAQKRAIFHRPQPVQGDRIVERDRRIHNQMILLMLSSICVFLLTTFPLTIDHMVSSYTIRDLSDIPKLLITMTILNWIQTLNCAVSFVFLSICI